MAKILIVEDNDDVREAIALVLARAGHDVVGASNAAAGRKALSDDGFDCAIVDVWMPDENGLELIDSLRNGDPKPPVIVISGGGPGRTLEHVTAKADFLGVKAFLYKPFEDDELLEALGKVLG